MEQPVVHTTCRICDAPLEALLSLGPQYLSDFPASVGTKAYPPVLMTLARCTAAPCGLVQLTHTTPREWMYRQYWYRSGVNETMRVELADVVRAGLDYAPAQTKHFVLGDIGANDGTLLKQAGEIFRVRGITHFTRIGWEPASNLYEHCRPHADVLFPDFFRVQGDPPLPVHLLTMIACFYDIEQPNLLVADAARILHPQGVWVIQQAYLPDMLQTCGYDNIGHEHLEYYHLQPLERLLLAHGLEVFHVEHRAINGGSFRAYVGHVGQHPIHPSVEALRAQETSLGLDTAATWDRFRAAVERQVNLLQGTLYTLATAGKTIDLYGASTKGNTILQTASLDARIIRQAWERSPEKLGRYVGVSGIPIVSENAGREDPPDALLVLPWSFKEAFIAREGDYLRAGGTLIFPLPTVTVIGARGGVGVQGVSA